MCYLVAKKMNKPGSIALQTSHGNDLVNLMQNILDKVGEDNIQLITISRPSAYGEYEPYSFAESAEEFKEKVYKMA
ncbi:MAG: DUF6718 family protein [Lachnospiraceae bacterium]|nr:DUF6718 family protein [Lachnospiraceae bacterium]